jgi:hypothetical protein
LAGTVLRRERGGQLRGAGGLADAGRADQRVDAALVLQRGFVSAGHQVALEHAGGPGRFVGDFGAEALGQLADQRRREAAVEQLLRQARLRGMALQLLHEGERAEALLDQALHRAQLVHHLLLAAQRGLVVGTRHGDVGQRGHRLHRRDGTRLLARRRLRLRGGGVHACGQAGLQRAGVGFGTRRRGTRGGGSAFSASSRRLSMRSRT